MGTLLLGITVPRVDISFLNPIVEDRTQPLIWVFSHFRGKGGGGGGRGGKGDKGMGRIKRVGDKGVGEGMRGDKGCGEGIKGVGHNYSGREGDRGNEGQIQGRVWTPSFWGKF